MWRLVGLAYLPSLKIVFVNITVDLILKQCEPSWPWPFQPKSGMIYCKNVLNLKFLQLSVMLPRSGKAA